MPGGTYSKTVRLMVLSALGCMVVTGAAHANMTAPENMVFCKNQYRAFTLYQSETPRFFQKDIILKDSGKFVVTATAAGFTFEGMSYERGKAWNKWKLLDKVSGGQRQWSQTWWVGKSQDHSLVRLQFIKDSNDCPTCTVKLEVKASQC